MRNATNFFQVVAKSTSSVVIWPVSLTRCKRVVWQVAWTQVAQVEWGGTEMAYPFIL
jgi:hypothetical protein